MQNFTRTLDARNKLARELRKKDQLLWEYLKSAKKTKNGRNSTLSSKEYKVLKLHLIDRNTLEETSRYLGVTRERIRQIENNAIIKMRIQDGEPYEA